MSFHEIFWYDPSKFELEYPFSQLLAIWTFGIFAMMNESALSCQNDTGKFSNFCLIVRPDPCDEIDDKRIICPSMRFFKMIPQSLKLSLFATYKLMKHPLASKRNGANFLFFFLRVRWDPNDEIDHKRNICPSMRFFDMTPQSLNLNIRFLNYWLFGHSEFLLWWTKAPSPVKKRRANFLIFAS